MELATASFSTALAHPILQQGFLDGPVGEHYPAVDGDRFPRKDEEGTCWVPQEYYNVSDEEQDDPNLWIDYEDPESQIKRADCDAFSFNDICSTPLYWNTTACPEKSSSSSGSSSGGSDAPAEEEKGRGGMPGWIVVPVQMLSAIWELHVVGMVTLPFWAFMVTLSVTDWLLDWVWLGLFFWCKFCAGFFIWLINIAFLPFHILGWLMRFRLETYGAVVDGWMLLIKGSGCYLRFGKHCWFNKRAKDRKLRTYWDIPLLWSGEIKNLFMPPQLEHASDVRRVGAEKRQILWDVMPEPFQATRALADTIFEL